MPSAPPNPPPKRASTPPSLGLPGLDIRRRLGAGGMAEVFLAKKRGAEETFKYVVLKRILPGFTTSRRFRSMFIDEAQLATRLNHPNVVQVYELANEGEEGLVLTMEYVEGCDLGQLMAAARDAGERIPPWTSAWIIAEAAKGLHYAHEKRDEGGAPLDIVHRDVSPQNVLLSYEGVVKIADFGIASARVTEEEQGTLKGKFGYMSPEQARGEKADRRSDLYALGVILWECLTGRPLHGGLGGEALLDMVRSGKVEPPSTYVRDIPEELETIALKLLSPQREDRYPTGKDLASEVARTALQKQVLVDASSLEGVIGRLVPRTEGHIEDARSHAEGTRPPEHATQAAAPLALSSADRSVPPASGGVRPTLPPISRNSRRPEAREVRHVAIVTLRLVTHRALDGDEKLALGRALERSRRLLGDMAFKHGMRWVWTGELEARAIAGLGPKPAKAASDAAWLAVETHEALAGIEDDLPVQLGASLSIVRGVASGTRDPEGNLVRYVLHDPVTYLADVLARTTPPKCTWVAGGVYRLTRREFRWGDAPILDLSNASSSVQHLPKAVHIYALERSLSREEKAQEQAHAPNDLIGRDAEKAELHAAFHTAVDGKGGGAVTGRVVVGELGIGKTALVATFLSELPPNARLVRAECTPVRSEVPFGTLADLVRDALGMTGEESLADAVKLVSSIGRAFEDPEAPMTQRLAELASNQRQDRESPDDDDAPYRKKLLVHGVRHLVVALAQANPLVIVVDGLQWADRPSIELVADILRAPVPLPVLFVLVTRPDDRVSQVLEGKVRIELHGLTPDEQVRLVETRLSLREGVREVCSELMPRVGGNPFYLLEMIDALLERGVLEIRDETLERAEGMELDASVLPSTLEQLLADRLQELPYVEHVLVDWLAIAGGPLTLADLGKLDAAAVDERDPGVARPTTEDAVVRLCARGLCDRKGDTLDFRHPLTRDVAYAALASTTRARMHRALGEHLAETSLARGVSAAIVARHLVRGDASARAATFYLEAAGAARSAHQTALATRYYQRAAQCLPQGDPRRLDVHASLEGSFRVLGRRKDRMQQLKLLRTTARSLGTPRAVCLALLRTARYDLDEGKLLHGLPIARRAAELAHTSKQPHFEIEAELLVSELSREVGEVQGALAAIDRALAACSSSARRLVSPRVRAEVLRSRGVLLRRVGRVREAVDAYVEAIGVFRKSSAKRQEARAKNALAYAMFVQGRYEDAIVLALESIRIDLSIGGRFQLAKTLTNIGHACARLGDMPRALAYLARARDTHERYGDLDGRADTLLVSAEVALEAGEGDVAGGYFDEAAAIVATTGNTYDITHMRIVSAMLARDRGEPSKAIEQALLARRGAEEQALVAYHFCALALEAAARADAGEVHSATLLATTASGAASALQGCEYGLEIRVLCADVLERSGSPEARLAFQHAVDHAMALVGTIRDPRFRRSFAARPLVAKLLARAEARPSVPALMNLKTSAPISSSRPPPLTLLLKEDG